MKSSFGKLIGVEEIDAIDDKMLYNVHGGNLPDYASHHEEMYNKSVTLIELRSNERPSTMGILRVELISSSKEDFTSLECSHDRQWTHYISTSNVIQLTPQQYRNALAFRMKLIPSVFANAIGEDYIQCQCEQQPLMCIRNLTKDRQEEADKSGQFVPLLKHLIKCPKLHQQYDSIRHDYVKNAIRRIAETYGITVHSEPSFYNYVGGFENRPDLTFSIPTQRHAIATDITIVQPHPDPGVEFIGRNAMEAANNKIIKHADAIHMMDHRFIPFALETTGHFDRGARVLFSELKNAVPFALKLNFLRDMYGAVSTALAQYRAEILTISLTRARTRN